MLARSAEALIGLSDAFPHWYANSRAIVGTVARTLVETRAPALVDGDVDVLTRDVLHVSAMSAALAHAARMGTRDLDPNQVEAVRGARAQARSSLESEFVELLVRLASRMCEADQVPPSPEKKRRSRGQTPPPLHPYIAYRLIRAISLTRIALSTGAKDLTTGEGIEFELPLGGLDSDRKSSEADANTGADADADALRIGAEQQAELSAATTKIAQLLRERTRDLVSQHQLHLVNHHDAIALCFAGAGLAIADPVADRRFIDVALRSSLTAQATDGSWPFTRIAPRDAGQPLEIAGFEVAATLAEAVLALLIDEGTTAESLAADLVPSLLAAIANTDTTMLDSESPTDPRTGWCAELAYGDQDVEALPTAMALEQALALARLAAEMRSREALLSFDALDTQHEYWPDWINWKTYKSESEPDHTVEILEWIDERLVRPRRDAVAPWARQKGDIVLMFGPPGTTKTTIVRSIAVGLGWPLVSLSPGDFIRDGLDMIEAQATRIFDRLHDINRAVVLFDECDELFRNRGQEPNEDGEPMSDGADQRGITAFVTASMLPKLQDLHDRSEVLVFVLTNFFGRLDPAIRRLGRIDYMIGIGPPDERQRKATIERELSGDTDLAQDAVAAAAALAAVTARYNRPELLAAIPPLRGKLRNAIQKGVPRTEEKIAEIAQEVRDATEGRVTVTAEVLTKFNTLASQISSPHTDPVSRR